MNTRTSSMRAISKAATPGSVATRVQCSVEVEDDEVFSLKQLSLSRVRWASLSIDLSDINTEEEAFELYRQTISNEVALSPQLPLICRISVGGATPLHKHLHEDRGRLRDELKAAADQSREDIWLEDVRVATSEPTAVQAGEANATGIDLSAMLSRILASPELLDSAKAEIHTIIAKMPTAALAAELSDDQTVRDLLDEAFELLSGAGLEGR